MTFQPGDIVKFKNNNVLNGERRTVKFVEGERVYLTNEAWTYVSNLQFVSRPTPALVPKYAVGDEVNTKIGPRKICDIAVSYLVEGVYGKLVYAESELSPVCSHTHTTCDECHEQLTKEK